jgi:hypothetical protein
MKTSLGLGLIVVGICMMTAAGAFAQSANSGAASQSQSAVNAQVQGVAGAQSNNTFTSPSDTTARIENVPAVSAPGVVTAHNCAMGVSAGVAAVGGGISFGGTYVDENCERISQAAALNTLAGRDAALIHLAQNPDMCKSLRAAGTIAPTSQCGDEPPAQPVASTRSANAAPAVSYTKCAFSDGAIRVGVVRGGDQQLAIAQCRAALGR